MAVLEFLMEKSVTVSVDFLRNMLFIIQHVSEAVRVFFSFLLFCHLYYIIDLLVYGDTILIEYIAFISTTTRTIADECLDKISFKLCECFHKQYTELLLFLKGFCYFYGSN